MTTTLWIITLNLLFGIGLGEAVEESIHAARQSVIRNCVQDLDSYQLSFEKAAEAGKDYRQAVQDNNDHLEIVVAKLRAVVDLEEYIRTQEERLAIIRASGPGWNHPKVQQLRRALQLMNSYLENQEAHQDGTGQPATRPESKSKGSDKSQPEAEGRSR